MVILGNLGNLIFFIKVTKYYWSELWKKYIVWKKFYFFLLKASLKTREVEIIDLKCMIQLL